MSSTGRGVTAGAAQFVIVLVMILGGAVMVAAIDMTVLVFRIVLVLRTILVVVTVTSLMEM